MGSDDKRDVRRDLLDPRLTLVRGGADEPTPHRAPRLELNVNPLWKLYQALKANDPRRVEDALAHGADVNARDPDGRTPLYEAVLHWKDPTSVAELLLDHGASLRVRDKDGQTPLHAAAMFGEEAHLRLFLERGAEIDARDARAQTPLHCAADLGRIHATTFLVSRGADVSICDHQGRTPLALVRRNHIMEYLGDDQRQLLERLLGGFMTARVVEARRNSLIVLVETLHSRYPEAERQAREGGTLTIPCGLLPEPPKVGDRLSCQKGLTRELSEAWREARRRDLGIERER